ncbi:MAG: hypothetical protein ABII85_01705 [Bacillota bacterium]
METVKSPVQSKYLNFIVYPPSGMKKTYVIFVKNKTGETLGTIKYHAPWRKYVWRPNNNTIYDLVCNEDINKILAYYEGNRFHVT